MNLSFMAVLAVGGGGFLGAVLRYLFAGWVTFSFKSITAPVGIAVVNITGCLLIGAIAAWFDIKDSSDPQIRLFLLTGLLGGYTTFSTYIFDTLALGRDGQFLFAFLNAGGQILAGLVCAWLGYQMMRWLI